MNKNFKLLVIVLTVVLFSGLLLVGCTPSEGPNETPETPDPVEEQPGSEPGTSKSRDRIVYGVGVDATTLDPHFADNVPVGNLVMHLHNTLVTWETPEEMNIVGSLAESWDVSEDEKTWTFYLTEGITFHDGAKFNAEAVKKTFERILDDNLGSPRKSILSMITDINVIDEYTVALTTEEPFGPFLSQLSTYNAAIISPKAIDEYGDDYSNHPSGTGPYKLKEWQSGERIILERNEDYFGDAPPTKELIFEVIPEGATRVMALQSGEVDLITNVPPYEVDNLRNTDGIEVRLDEGFRTIYLGFNLQRPPFDDVRVRQALNYAIDRQSIIDVILDGAATMAVGPEATSIPGASKDLYQYTYNPQKAKELLVEAGYEDGIEISFISPQGRYNMDRQIAEAIQAQLGEAGIKANLQVLEFSIIQDILASGEADLFLMGKGSPAADLDFTAQICWTIGGSLNYGKMKNQEIHDLVAEQRRTTDPVERTEVLQTMQEKIQEELPWASLHYEKQIIAHNKNMTGLKVWPNEFIDFRSAEIKE